MAQPGSVPPPIEPPSPFSRPAERPASRGGCGKPVMIGCIVLLVLLGIGVLVLVMNMQRFSGSLLAWSLGTLEKQVLATLPPDVTPAEKERLQAAFASGLAAIREKRFDPQRLPALQAQIMGIARGGGKVTREQILELTRALEEIDTGAPPAEAPPSSASPSEAPQGTASRSPAGALPWAA